MHIANSSIKLFKIGSIYYLFDYAKREIIKCNYSDLKINHFTFTDNPSNKYDPPTFKLLPYLSNYNAFIAGFRRYHRYLQLVVTESCNMRCKYCFYSNNDYRYYRKHSNNSMDYSLAESAVFDLLNNKYDNDFIIAFFGGEPLLQIHLIEKIVNIVKNKFPSKHVTFRTTTNGTLLTPAIVKFLADNNFALNISIDGNKDIHDSNRVFANGKPTYDRIIHNVNFIKSKYPEYFFSNVQAHATVGNKSDYNRCIEAFRRYGFVEASVDTYIEGSTNFAESPFYMEKDFIQLFINAYLNKDVFEFTAVQNVLPAS